jgi:ribonuclease T2
MMKFIPLVLVGFSFNVGASNIITGTFEATQVCPTYASALNQSNPDNLTIEINTTYPLREINESSSDWLRIEFPDHQLRWIHSSCGVVTSNKLNSSSCSSVGMADSHLLALSSQSGFCETYGFEAGKPECRKLSKSSYQASHLTLHGLWPNQDVCGQRYGYCGVKPQSNHCGYAPVTLTPKVTERLKTLMPSFNFGSCLERHEWNKHGSCQALSADDYFTLAMGLVSEVDKSAFGKYLTAHKGETVKLSTLRDLITESFGAKNAGKVYLGCKNNILVDIFIQLPALIPFNESLVTLITSAPDNRNVDFCSAKVVISNFTKESWL